MERKGEGAPELAVAIVWIERDVEAPLLRRIEEDEKIIFNPLH